MVVVKGEEIVKIGHSKTSQTFLPSVVDPREGSEAKGLIFCDCPGFEDNRGAEINIANAVIS